MQDGGNETLNPFSVYQSLTLSAMNKRNFMSYSPLRGRARMPRHPALHISNTVCPRSRVHLYIGMRVYYANSRTPWTFCIKPLEHHWNYFVSVTMRFNFVLWKICQILICVYNVIPPLGINYVCQRRKKLPVPWLFKCMVGRNMNSSSLITSRYFLSSRPAKYFQHYCCLIKIIHCYRKIS